MCSVTLSKWYTVSTAGVRCKIVFFVLADTTVHIYSSLLTTLPLDEKLHFFNRCVVITLYIRNYDTLKVYHKKNMHLGRFFFAILASVGFVSSQHVPQWKMDEIRLKNEIMARVARIRGQDTDDAADYQIYHLNDDDNICYETSYNDPNYTSLGYTEGPCHIGDVLDKTVSTVCLGKSDVNIKYCDTKPVTIAIYKIGVN